MEIKLIWTENSLEKLETIISYLDESWSESVRKKFVNALENKIEQIISQPLSGIKSNIKKDFRKVLITKHCYLIYRFTGKEIEIINFKDTRQKPNGN
jgi:plasmid stabilization system protein ParE